ncbi:hypothetical protein NKL07_21905 [Mesorhizobium sp. C280B]|uniref:hypothetical protein n=1 Tax=unclassified Mesorhizobium TaxID=325217 RepID=UPI0003CE7EB3|nr:hypothetical protein [Mesorhizobium sp. LSJC280B00]ESW92667.1 hypothetical protein X772_02995 [Mesorhizobium sp. LSJC280B00]
MRHDRYDDLTPEELAAVQAYAAKHGRMWKSILRGAWLGQPPYDDTGTLRNLRNTHGPSWLDGFKLPKA